VWIFDQFEKTDKLRILELGCGTGLLWRINESSIPFSWNITLSDYSKGMIEAAKRNLESVNMRFNYMVIDAEDINLSEKSFDVIIANNMLYHVKNREKTLSGIKRIIKDDGIFYATTAGINNLTELVI
jgi:ubiquinone/menaquinone biosynthesis C-methylase UbiE